MRSVLRNKSAFENYVLHAEGSRSAQRNIILSLSPEEYDDIDDLLKPLEFLDSVIRIAEMNDEAISIIPYLIHITITFCSKTSDVRTVTKDFISTFVYDYEERTVEYKQNRIIRITSFLDPRFCMRRELFSDTEWNEIKTLILELAEDKDATEEVEALSCENEVQWSLKDTISESSISTEINSYIVEKRIQPPSPSSRTFNEALNFWKENRKKYQKLSKLARRFLSVTPSSAEPERTFSNLTYLLENPRRAGLSDDTIADLMEIRLDIACKRADANKKRKSEIEDFEDFEYKDSSDIVIEDDD